MDTIQITGGARIGFANATWPFVTLKVNSTKLELNASLVGRFVFQRQDIISLEPYSRIFSKGIKINHKVPAYNSNIIFWTFKDPAIIIDQITAIGFLGNNNSSTVENYQEIIEQQKSGSFPIKKSVAIFYVVLWNVLFLSDFIRFLIAGKPEFPLRYGAITAMGLLFISSILLLVSKKFAQIILKEGKTIEDIGKFIYLMIAVSAILLVSTSIFACLGQ